MSIQAVDWVLKYSRSEHAERLVLFALANHASTDESIAFPSVQTLGQEAKLSRRAVQGALGRLLELGEIVEAGKTRSGTRCFRLPCLPAQILHPGRIEPAGAQNSTLGGADPAPKSSRNRKEPSESPPTYRGKKVAAPTVAEAHRLLGVFNEATERGLSAQSHIRQIVGALLSRPEVRGDQWERAICSTVANPPSFVEGDVQLGHIFGERAVDYALANSGRPRRSGPVIPAAGMCRECNRRPRLTGSTHCGPCRDELEAKLTGGPVAA